MSEANIPFAQGIDFSLIFCGIFTLYLGLLTFYNRSEKQNLQDRQIILEEILDNANDVIFDKYAMHWITD